jgi:hypothetical protein
MDSVDSMTVLSKDSMLLAFIVKTSLIAKFTLG